MSCIPSSSKCEWSEIRHFVDHYNAVCGSAYKRQACLDVETRNCAQPELLCRDEAGQREIVIERKLLTWPSNHVEQHKNEHDLFERIVSLLNSELDTQAYTLEVSPPRHMRKREKRIALASDLVDKIKQSLASLQPGGGLSSTIPFPWSFRKEYPGERDDYEPKHGLKIETTSRMPQELEDPTQLPPQLLDSLSNCYESCERKFIDFRQSTKILLLQLLPASLASGLDETWWQQLFSHHPPPSTIDEIWSAVDYGEESRDYAKVYDVTPRH